MTSLFSIIFATFVSIPILVYIIIFVVSKMILKNHRKAVRLAIDVSTIFFILSVHYLIYVIWQRSLLWVIFIFLLVCAIIFVVITWKVKEEIVFSRVMRGFWRFSFLIFFIAYLSLIVYGLIQRVTLQLT